MNLLLRAALACLLVIFASIWWGALLYNLAFSWRQE